MTTAVQEQITDEFEWKVPPQVRTSFIEGKSSQPTYEAVKEVIDTGLWYNSDTKTMKGSNPFIAAKIDSLVRPLGIRVANLRDLSKQEVMGMVEDRFYSDAPALVLRSTQDSCERNLPLIQRITDLVEQKEGRVSLPLMLTGFDVEKWPEDEKGYGLTIVPRDDFTVISNERLKGEYNRKRFNNVDEAGIPDFDSNGKRTWHTRDGGLSRVYLDRSLDLNFWGDDVGGSNEFGRVVLVKGGEATRKILKLN